jgi:apolipoprotein N-acyltransferase
MATGTRRMDTAKMQASAAEKAWRASAQAAPAPAAPASTPGVGFNLLAASMLSGGLLWACFQPLALGAFLGWIALVPFLVLVRAQARPRFLYCCAWLTGVCFFTPALQWMRVADDLMFLAWFALSMYCALFFPAALFWIRRLERWNIPLVVSVPAVWVAFEYVRCWLLTGFPWYLLAHTQHDILPMIQIADLGGVFLVSAVVAAVNAFVFDVAWQFPEVRQWFGQPELEPHRTYASWDLLNRSFLADWLFRRNLILEGGALALLVIGTYTYGMIRLAQNEFHAGPTVCLLQSNLDQRIRDNTASPEVDGHSVQTVMDHFDKLCIRASLNHHPKPDLLIWPETSFYRPWYEVSRKLPNEKVPHKWRDDEIDIRDWLDGISFRYTRIPHLIGINGNDLDENGKHRRYNTALFLNAQGKVDGRFDKIHRVPFGEYVPLQDWLPFMKVFSVYDYDFGVQPGEKYTRFKLDKYHFGVLICYEDSDPFMARRYLTQSDDGPPVDFLVNISNDGWFDGSCEHEEHLAVSRFRAIECRRAMVRAVNMGVSAVIDSNGRVLKPTPYPNTSPPVWLVSQELGRIPDFAVADWHKFKKTAGILKATVPIDDRFSFYALAGDWLPIGCWAGMLGGAGWAYWRRKKTTPSPLAKA